MVLVAVPLMVREPQPQLLGWHVAASADSHVAGRGRDGLARRLLLRYVDRRGGRAVDLEVRVARQGRELCGGRAESSLRSPSFGAAEPLPIELWILTSQARQHLCQRASPADRLSGA